jgi:peptidyl-prolyl cis-trans isomerase B (cyclophilin B)
MEIKISRKSILNFTFAAMLVFTAAMLFFTIRYFGGAGSEVLDDTELVLPQSATLSGNIADDAKIAVISTDHGDMAAELYPEHAPKAVANFIDLAESGYYNGTLVYEIEKGIHLGAGSGYGDGSLPKGYDEKYEKIEPEITDELWPLRGALMSVGLKEKKFWTGKTVYSGSRFIVSGSIKLDNETKDLLGQAQAKRVSGMFLEYGGTPNVSKQLTVFAQIFDGWDVLDSILNEETEAEAQLKKIKEKSGSEGSDSKTDEDEANDYVETSKPVKDIEIKTVKIMSYADYKAQSADTES